LHNPFPYNPEHAYLFTLQDNAHSADFPEPEGDRATNLNVDILVNMAWCDIRVTPLCGEHGWLFRMARVLSRI